MDSFPGHGLLPTGNEEFDDLSPQNIENDAPQSSSNRLKYSIEDVPPWYLCILLGFQQYLIMFGSTLTIPLILSKAMCITEDNMVVTSELIGTIFFVSGMCTLIQTSVGIRLPLIQGGAFAFLIPSMAILGLDKWKCSSLENTDTNGGWNQTGSIISGFSNTGNRDEWKPRICEIQGAIMLSSIFEVFIGFTGIVGFLLRFIGPLTIAPTITLIGLSLFTVATDYASKHWGIAMLTIALITLFSQYLKSVEIPCFKISRKNGSGRIGFPIFRLFPVILAIVITWSLCWILTAAGVFTTTNGSGAATNLRLQVMQDAFWFRIPYPGQWGWPTVSAAAFLSMISGVLASMIESIGDYYACARMSGAPTPPTHAVNRGIGIEGIGCIIAGAFGSGSGTTSYSENIGAIGITKVASRRVIQYGAVIMMLFGIFGKFGAIFVTIPDPIIGGVFIVMFSMITAVGISNLQFADLSSSRNHFVIGFSFFFGLALPHYMNNHSNLSLTGVEVLDQIMTVLLRTSMFVGGFSAVILDNTMPGSDQERGLVNWRAASASVGRNTKDVEPGSTDLLRSAYDIPVITKHLHRVTWTRYVPFLPTYDETLISGEKFKQFFRRKSKPSNLNQKQTDTKL